MAKYSYEYEAEPAKRPSFLTWLCILTFIGSGWAIVSSVYTYTSVDKYANILSTDRTLKVDTTKVKGDTIHLDSSVTHREKGSEFSEKIKVSFSKILEKENMRKLAIGNLIASLLTLAGAILMWNLNKTGFYIYIIGVIVSLVVPFILFGNDLIAVGAASFNNFFGLVFIALYALNLKSMRRNAEKIDEENR